MKKKIRKGNWTFEIIRRDSKYNKYIKWFVEGVADNGAKCSLGYKTQREALAHCI